MSGADWRRSLIFSNSSLLACKWSSSSCLFQVNNNSHQGIWYIRRHALALEGLSYSPQFSRSHFRYWCRSSRAFAFETPACMTRVDCQSMCGEGRRLPHQLSPSFWPCHFSLLRSSNLQTPCATATFPFTTLEILGSRLLHLQTFKSFRKLILNSTRVSTKQRGTHALWLALINA